MLVEYVSLEFGGETGALDINPVTLDVEMEYKATGVYEITYRECVKREKEK